MKAIRAFEIEGENQGKSLRGPLTAAAKRIKEIEDAGLAIAVKARNRLKSMLDARAAEKFAEQQAEAAKAAAAQKKLDDDRIAAEQAAAKLAEDQRKAEVAAEQARQDAEKARQEADRANSPEAKAAAAKAQADAAAAQQQAKADADRLAKQAEDAAFEASMADIAPAPAAPAPIEKVAGYSARMVRDYEVLQHTDAFHAARNLERFAAWVFANPTLNLARFLKIEIKRADMLEFLKDESALKDGAPGIRIFSKVASR